MFPTSLQSASPIVMPPGQNLASTFQQPFLYGGSTSCGSAGFCAEVGEYGSESEIGSGSIVVPINNGAAAPAVQVALPADAVEGAYSQLNSISCSGTNSCVAVGSYDVQISLPVTENVPSRVISEDSPTAPMVVPVANGNVGTAVEVQLPANASDLTYAQLYSVSCDPSGNCVAVGSYVDDGGNTEAMVVPISGGSVGPAVEVAAPSDPTSESQDAELSSVSCEASGACVAVGDYLDADGNEQAIVTPVSSAGALGTSTMLSLPGDATGSPNAYLFDVSCPATGDCAALGEYNGANSNEPMATSISAAGVAATAVQVTATLSNADSATDVWANAVGCGAAGCNIVGSYGDDNGSHQALVIPVSGGSGNTSLGNESRVSLPGDAVQDGTGGQWATLYDISCSSAGACLASGGYTGVYQGLNSPVYSDLAPENINGLLVGISGSSVDTGTSAPLPADAATAGRLSFGAGVGCGTTGSCAVTSVYLQGLSTTTDLISTLQCINYSEYEGSCNYSGTVQPYVVSAQAPLTISPGSVPTTVTAGTTSISLSSVATGGWGPYQWSVANGNTLPAGLSLDPFTGVISGTPQTPGTYTLWVRADSLGNPNQNAEASLTLKVGAAATTATVTSTTTTTVTPPGTSPITPANASNRKPSLIVVRGNLRDHGGVVQVHLRCHSWEPCSGTVTLSWHGHAISNAGKLAIPAGMTSWVTVHLNAAGTKLTASLRKPRHGYPTVNVVITPKLTVGRGIPNSRTMWVI